MISVERLQLLMGILLLNPLRLSPHGFLPRYSTNASEFALLFNKFDQTLPHDGTNGRCFWWHEEPINQFDFDDLMYKFPLLFNADAKGQIPIASGPGSIFLFGHDIHFHLVANSEKSKLKKELLKKWILYDWYFFFHGFAALDWYSEFKYFIFKESKFDKVFICLNHNISKNRSYRLYLLSLIKSNSLQKFGHISSPLLSQQLIKKEIFDNNSKLSRQAKLHIFKNLYPDARPVILDACDYNNASATVGDLLDTNANSTNLHTKCLWHVITETVFYEEKLHLTEKVFKPIAIQRPFILVASPGNLQYLKDYGFKTFDQWIDESYDTEPDPNIRLEKIVLELEKLCKLTSIELTNMYEEMQEILLFNHDHFYGKFKEMIVNELVDNFEGCVKQYNLGLSKRFQLPIENINFDSAKRLLLS